MYPVCQIPQVLPHIQDEVVQKGLQVRVHCWSRFINIDFKCCSSDMESGVVFYTLLGKNGKKDIKLIAGSLL